MSFLPLAEAADEARYAAIERVNEPACSMSMRDFLRCLL